MKPAKDHVNTIMLKEMARKLVYLNGILDASPNIILVLDLKMKIVMFSKSGEYILGYKEKDLYGTHFSTIFKKNQETRDLIKLIKKEDIDEYQIQAKTKKGELISFSMGVRKLIDDENTSVGYVVNMHDIHRRIQLEKRLRRQYAELDSIVTNSGAMIVTTNAKGTITKINPSAEKVLGVKSHDMIGRTMIDFYVDKDLRRDMVKKLKKKESVEYEAEIKTADGSLRIFYVVLSNIRSPLTNKLLGTVGISHDITLRKQAEDKLHTMLITDPLTNLGNRRHFFDQLKNKLSQAVQSPRHSFCLAFVDFDGFKAYNDTFGHQKGDELLDQFGQLCTKNSKNPPQVSFYRYGGDEFVSILHFGDLSKAKRLLNNLRKKFYDMTSGHVTLSIGLTKYHRKDNQERIINRADAAVYKSKKLGRNRITVDDTT